MTVRIFGQIGRHNKTWFHVFHKRNPPKVGDKIVVGLYPFVSPMSRAHCEVVGIKELEFGQLFKLRRIEEEQADGVS